MTTFSKPHENVACPALWGERNDQVTNLSTCAKICSSPNDLRQIGSHPRAQRQASRFWGMASPAESQSIDELTPPTCTWWQCRTTLAKQKPLGVSQAAHLPRRHRGGYLMPKPQTPRLLPHSSTCSCGSTRASNHRSCVTLSTSQSIRSMMPSMSTLASSSSGGGGV